MTYRIFSFITIVQIGFHSSEPDHVVNNIAIGTSHRDNIDKSELYFCRHVHYFILSLKLDAVYSITILGEKDVILEIFTLQQP